MYKEIKNSIKEADTNNNYRLTPTEKGIVNLEFVGVIQFQNQFGNLFKDGHGVLCTTADGYLNHTKPGAIVTYAYKDIVEDKQMNALPYYKGTRLLAIDGIDYTAKYARFPEDPNSMVDRHWQSYQSRYEYPNGKVIN